MYLYKSISNKKDKQIKNLFFMLIILSQGIRSILNESMHTSVFNYDVLPIILIIFMVFYRKNKFDKINMICVLGITGLITIGFFINSYEVQQLLRSILGFILPLFILIIDSEDVNMEDLFPKLMSIFNIFIIINFCIQIIMSIKIGRTGGIIGHPLTAGWYYAMYISFNCIHCKYFKRKKDIFIIKDIALALLGSILASGRIAMFSIVLLGIAYAISCCKNKIIPYILMPILISLFLTTSLANEYIWDKFKYATSYGDVTNGRLLGVREMIFCKLYPQFFTGNGIGYSNYISTNLFATLNFENPILMFSFDYGILTVILLLVISFFKPLIQFLKAKNFLLALNFILIFIIPFTYNGIAETVGIFIVLIFAIYIFLSLNYYLVKIKIKEV